MKFTRPKPPQAITTQEMDIEAAISYWYAAKAFADKLETQSLWHVALGIIWPLPLLMLFNVQIALVVSVLLLVVLVWSILLLEKTRTDAAAYKVVTPEVMRDLIPSAAWQQEKYRQLLNAQGGRLLKGQADLLRIEFTVFDAQETVDAFLKDNPYA